MNDSNRPERESARPDSERLNALERRFDDLEGVLLGRVPSLRALPFAADAEQQKNVASLVPMQEEQLAILRRSEEERKKRAEADKVKREADERWREYRRIMLALLAFLTISMQVVFEALRSAHH